ncbi:MAG: hypothetical protein AAF850_06125 [Pseudomonadota bacterium]
MTSSRLKPLAAAASAAIAGAALVFSGAANAQSFDDRERFRETTRSERAVDDRREFRQTADGRVIVDRRADRLIDGFRWRDGRFYRVGDRRVIYRDVVPTRFRARIHVREEVVFRRRGPVRVCTVSLRGAERRFISDRRLRRVARNHCSPRARLRVRA